jgi:hypothetical protein
MSYDRFVRVFEDRRGCHAIPGSPDPSADWNLALAWPMPRQIINMKTMRKSG